MSNRRGQSCAPGLQPGRDFTAGPFDSLLGSRIYWRRRVFPVTLQATFPAVGGVSTIVIGQAESSQPPQSSTRWVLTVMHEHFHQWQESRPGYQAAVDSLGLARGDTTGMWMLNFPFPYADSAVAARFDTLCRRSARALRARGTAAFAAACASRDAARREFWSHLSHGDARYLAFQLWKEGVARYTEYDVARAAAAAEYRPSASYRGLADYTSFAVEAEDALGRILDELSRLSLAKWRRTAVYPAGAAGAAGALLLAERRPSWKAVYTRKRFSIEGIPQESH